jgi:organic hydroperoxide reductase OsmC/OhrA
MTTRARRGTGPLHLYQTRLVWTGASHGPTKSYAAYSRDFQFECAGKPPITASADPHFHGNSALYNPEELFVAALSSCHMLTYLADCARAGILVLSYEDDARGVMAEQDGKMRFTDVVLKPRVVVAAETDVARALALHADAHDGCFIASSVNFEVRHDPTISVAGPEGY